MDKCDICEEKTDFLVDYFLNICQNCKSKHTDIVLLKKLGQALNKIENLEKIKNDSIKKNKCDHEWRQLISKITGYIEDDEDTEYSENSKNIGFQVEEEGEEIFYCIKCLKIVTLREAFKKL